MESGLKKQNKVLKYLSIAKNSVIIYSVCG